jgi:hypothetical protein
LNKIYESIQWARKTLQLVFLKMKG